MDSVNKSGSASLESLGLAKPKVKKGTQQQKLGQEDFIKLMTTQMNQQDPFKPMADGKFISDMAQFSTVTGLNEIKSAFNTLANSLKSNQALQASSMVGRKVLVDGSKSTYSEGKNMHAAVQLDNNVAGLKVSIMDDKGALVKELNLGDKPAGVVQFDWDGKLDNGKQATSGNYQIHAIATVDGKEQSQKTLITDLVQSVSLSQGAKGVSLSLANAGSANLADVKEIL